MMISVRPITFAAALAIAASALPLQALADQGAFLSERQQSRVETGSNTRIGTPDAEGHAAAADSSVHLPERNRPLIDDGAPAGRTPAGWTPAGRTLAEATARISPRATQMSGGPEAFFTPRQLDNIRGN